MRIELGWHANPCLVGSLGSPMRSTRFSCFDDPCTECFRKGGCVRCRWLHRRRRGNLAAALDAFAELLLDRTNLSQKYNWIERAVLRTQAPLDCFLQLWMRQGALVRRHRIIIALDHFGAFAALLLQLE